MKLKVLICTVCLIALAAGNSFAEKEQLHMKANELKILPVNKLLRVAVGDPAVADVSLLSDQEMMLMAKSAGSTTLIIWDESGQHFFNIIVVAKDLENIAQRIRELLVSSGLQGMRVKTEEDKVYVMGEVLSEGELSNLETVLTPFAEDAVNMVKLKDRMPLVEIDVNILEIVIDDLKELGLDWSSAWPITYSEPSGSKIDGKVTKVWKVFRWDRSTINAKLNFLISEDKARTLANPRLVTLSGKEASFLVGGEVPYVTQTEVGKTQVEWKDYGVKLTINPLVNAQNEIKTQMHAEVTDLDWANAVSQEGFNIPALKKREAKTELFLNEEDTIFIAGLIKSEDTHNIDRLPWMSKVPILGELFKSTDFRDERTELVISLTPRIVGEKATPEYLTSEMLEQEALLAAQQKFAMYSEETSPLAAYTHMIEDIITRNVVYPLKAREEKQEGIVKVSLYLLSNGQLKEAQIQESSGSHTLDMAALAAVREQSPYPSFPSSITQQAIHLSVPVVFKSYSGNE